MSEAAFQQRCNDLRLSNCMRLIKHSWKPGKPSNAIYSICFAASNPRGQ